MFSLRCIPIAVLTDVRKKAIVRQRVGKALMLVA